MTLSKTVSWVIMLTAMMLNVAFFIAMQSVVMLSVITLSVVAPF
jgi:hypothetical protein